MTAHDRADPGGARPAGASRTGPGESDRISTGNLEADRVLHGGFPRNSINVIMGQPGTGKTIFAEQLAFHNAGGDRPILYFSTLAEPLTKLVRYLQQFSFFDDKLLGTAVIYDDIGADLAQEGTQALVRRLADAVKTRSPRIIFIDSFKAIHDLAPGAQAMRKLVHEITGLLTAYDTTAFLLGEYSEEDIQHYPEFAIADSVVQLSRRGLGTRDERFFRVFKLRGSGYAEGAHALRISGNGVQVYPRLVTPEAAEEYEPVLARAPTGVAGLDAMVEGGFWKGSTTIVAGPSGSGKTTISLQFAAEGAARGEPTLYVNFQENPRQLARSIQGLGHDLDELEDAGLQFLYASPVEMQIDTVIVDVFKRIEEHGVQRLVVDAVGDLAAAASDAQRLHDYIYALIQHLASRNVTSIFTFETLGHSVTGAGISQGAISYMSDNLILLDMGGEERTRRTLRVLKTRASAHDPRVRELELDARGARVGE